MKTDVQQRWLAGGRQFAPWHYGRDAMLADDQSKFFASRRDAGSSEVRRFACRLQALVDGGPKDLGWGCTSAK